MAAKKATTKGKEKAAPATEPGKGLQPWDEQLAKYAAEAAAVEANAGSGLHSFSLKAGVLSLDDQPMPNNEMAVVVLDHILEDLYYANEYDPDAVTPPSAYALGRDEKTMRWSDDSIAPYAGELCKDSDINQWGSAKKGRGKACRNMRRLLMIPAGTFDKHGEFKLITDENHYKNAEMAFMKVPPTSITNWAVYVKQLAGALKKPPFAVVTKIKVIPDAKSQFKVTFEAMEELPADLFETLVSKHDQAAQLIMQPYDLSGDAEEKPEPKGKGKAAAKKKGRGKY